MRNLALSLFLTIPLFCQSFAIGVKGGLRVTSDLEGYATSESKRYLVGPAVEVKLPLRLAIEVDALYSRFGLRTANGGFFGSYTQSQRANSWEFPILAKFRPFRPVFVEGGFVPRTMSGGSTHYESISIDFSGNSKRDTGDLKTDYDASRGWIVGGGLELPFRHLRLAPEVRYTRWNDQPVFLYGPHGYFVQSTQNRADIIIGLWWK